MTDPLYLMLVLNAITHATSLTVTVRRVQNHSPSYYRYAPELHSHRATTPSPQAQERLHIVRIPKYRRKYRYRVKNVRPIVYPVVVAQRPKTKKYHEPRPLPTIVSNEVDDAKEEYDLPPVSVDDGVSFPSFGKDSPYQAIRKPQEWSTPAPVKDADATFTPVQMYLQIRQSNQVKHVPQSEALKDATTLEEVVNAPRLKELLRTTRVREVYSEEGYEDAGYDHGGHIRQAEHDEAFVAQDEGVFKLKESVKEEDYTVPEANQSAEKPKIEIPPGVKRRVPDEVIAQESKMESRSEVTSMGFATLPSKYKGEHKYSSKIRARTQDGERKQSTEPTGFWSPTVFDGLPSPTMVFTLPKSANDPTEGTTQRAKYIKIIATSEEPGRMTNSTLETKRSRNKGFKYSRLHAKYPKRDRFRLAKLNQVVPTMETVETSQQTDDKRIILPTIGYINSLTTAHFGKNKTNHPSNSNQLLTTPLNLTQALNYLRSNRKHPVRKKSIIDDGASFEAKKLRNRSRRESDDEEEEHEEDIPDDGEEVHDEKNEEIEEEERQRTAGEEEDTEYEKRLREELDREEEEIVKATIGRYEPKDDSDVLESLKQAYEETTTADEEVEVIEVTTAKPVDTSKYPFYFSRQVNADSPLRYATNPKTFPRKKGKGMVFYESRDKLVQCPDVRPDLSDIPKKNATLEADESEHSRLAGLGDKIACLRMKYFDEDPLDNPLFKEKEIDYVGRVRYKAENATDDNMRKGRESYLPKLKYHSSYQYQPNRTLDIMVKGEQSNGTLSERIIPVTENVDETPPQRSGRKKPTPIRRKFIRPTYRPFATSTPSPNRPVRSRLIIPHNCMHVIAKMASLDGQKNLIIDCNDAMLTQEMRNGVRYLKIIPKIPEVTKKNAYARRKYVPFESTDRVPRFGRTESDHYLITELKEEGDVRKGEVVEESANATTIRRRRAVQEEGHNVPLRLSLKEFFVLLQNGNGRNRFAPKPFQLPTTSPKPFQLHTTSPNPFQLLTTSPKPFQLPTSPRYFYLPSTSRKPFQPSTTTTTTTTKPLESVEDEEVVKLGGQYIKGTNGREMVYFKLHPSLPGRWIFLPETSKYAKKPSKNIYKKYGKGKL